MPKNKPEDDLYNQDFEIERSESNRFGQISEQDRLLAAKQILIGLAIVFVIADVSYLFYPAQGSVLLEICKVTLPPLATLIIAFYFKEKY